nr:uncharacterized protein LOC122271416 [Parasteatoda tepidariorum]
MKEYKKVKNIILKEFQPTPEVCLENFLSAERLRNENHMQFASRIRANWDFYCQLRKVSNFEMLNELIVSDRILNALDPEARSYIKIKQLDTWFRPKQIAELCDNWFTSKGRTFSELYDKPTNKFRNQIETGFPNNSGGKYVPPHMRNFNDKNTSSGKECKLCKQIVHLRYCPNREKTATIQSKRDPAVSKPKTEDKLIARVKTKYIDPNSIKSQPLQYEYIYLGGKEIKALIDSAADMPILNSNEIPLHLKNNDCLKVHLISAFGENIVADLQAFSISLKSEYPNNLSSSADVLFSVTDKLVVLAF